MGIWNWIKGVLGFGPRSQGMNPGPDPVASMEDSCVAHYKMNTLVCRVSGTISPDATGIYIIDGLYDDEPYYKRLDNIYYIWYKSSNNTWVINTTVGNIESGNYWCTASGGNIFGEYVYTSGTHTGTPIFSVTVVDEVRPSVILSLTTIDANAPDKLVNGRVNNSLLFYNDNIDIEETLNDTFNSEFTIAGWFMATDGRPPQIQTIFGVQPTDSKLCGISISVEATGKLLFTYQAEDEEIYTQSGVILTNGQEDWHFVVITCKNADTPSEQIEIYFDNILVATGNTESGNPVDLSSYETSLFPYIGAKSCEVSEAYPAGVRNYFDGLLDNIIIFNRALNSEEIAILYNSGSGTEDFQLTPQLDLSGSEILMGI